MSKDNAPKPFEAVKPPVHIDPETHLPQPTFVPEPSPEVKSFLDTAERAATDFVKLYPPNDTAAPQPNKESSQ